MKKLIKSLLLGIISFIPCIVFASGYISASPTSITIEEGSSKSFTITAYNAIGDVTISSNNSGVASVSASDWSTGMVDSGQTKTGSISVFGKSVGSATITLVVDGATFDSEDLAGQVITINVNVISKPVQPQEQPKDQPSNNNNNNKTQNNNNKNSNLSSNTKLKSLTVEGFELEKVDANNYKLTVNNSVTSISLKAESEDDKAKVTGAGKKELSIGDNNFSIVVEAENGSKNTVNVVVTRKDSYYLEDLSEALNNSNNKNVDIKIDLKTVLTKESLSLIKNSKKDVILNYFDESGYLLYSWTINAKSVEGLKRLNTEINFESKNVEKIAKAINYSDGIYLHFNHNGNFSNQVKVKIFVGNKYKDNDLVNIYYYNEKTDKVETIHTNIKVINGYIEFDINHCSDYFVTRALINTKVSPIGTLGYVLSISEGIVICGLAGYIILNNKRKTKKHK